MSLAITLREDDLSGPEIRALLEAHLVNAALHSPPESVHALDMAALRASDITFWTAWQGEALLACGALKELEAGHGEIKSMHTAQAHRGKGIAGQLVVRILQEAALRSYRRVSLETGSMTAYAPARGLYGRFGFEECPPFGEYEPDPHSFFMTRIL